MSRIAEGSQVPARELADGRGGGGVTNTKDGDKNEEDKRTTREGKR